jgi:prepilin-type N-terminal cleavage/methylation domain-containing protein
MKIAGHMRIATTMTDQLEQRRARQDGFTLIEVLVSMIIMSIVTAMLVGIWIVLLHSSAFAEADNTASSTGRGALDRVAAELRDAQPPNSTSTTPFIFTMSSPYVCDANDCVFYSSYNNAGTALQSGANGEAKVLPTAIWLDGSGTTSQKKLWWWRDTNTNGLVDSADQTILLANNVVNTASSVNRPIFTYVFRDKTGAYTTATSLTATTVANLVSVNVELVIDANLNDKPTYIDFVSTVRPRNQGTNQ